MKMLTRMSETGLNPNINHELSAPNATIPIESKPNPCNQGCPHKAQCLKQGHACEKYACYVSDAKSTLDINRAAQNPSSKIYQRIYQH